EDGIRDRNVTGVQTCALPISPDTEGFFMLLTITSTHRPATDLGYLLHKNPARCQSFALSFGRAHVFYPEADAERCTAALYVEVEIGRASCRERVWCSVAVGVL